MSSTHQAQSTSILTPYGSHSLAHIERSSEEETERLEMTLTLNGRPMASNSDGRHGGRTVQDRWRQTTEAPPRSSRLTR